MQGRAEGAIDFAVYQRFFIGHRGTCLEIGAARPDWLSIGALYRDKGWDVLSVEPNPTFAAQHRALGHDVAEVALADVESGSAPFTVVDCEGAAYRDGRVTFESWSSLGVRGDFATLNVPERQREIAVRVCRADTLLRERRPGWREIDLVTIDIEGWELEALSGLDFARHRPRVVVMENLFLDHAYRRFMRKRGYSMWRRTHPNEIYVRRDMLSVVARVAARARSVLPTLAGRARVAAASVWRALHQPKRTPVNSATNVPV